MVCAMLETTGEKFLALAPKGDDVTGSLALICERPAGLEWEAALLRLDLMY